MKVIKSLSNALVTTVDSTAKVVHTTLPAVGETLYHTASMLKDAVYTARLEALIENQAEVERIKSESQLKDFTAIEAAMAY